MTGTMITTPFGTDTRVHIGLACTDLERSIGFYQTLLGEDPTKRKPDYAKFEPASPALTLSLIHSAHSGAAARPPSHFGLRVADKAELEAAAERLADVCPSIRREESVECCYAVQHKIWATDPDGNAWEIYQLLSDAGESLAKRPAAYDGDAAACCDAACCT